VKSSLGDDALADRLNAQLHRQLCDGRTHIPTFRINRSQFHMEPHYIPARVFPRPLSRDQVEVEFAREALCRFSRFGCRILTFSLRCLQRFITLRF